MDIAGNLVDIEGGKIFKAQITVNNGVITNIQPSDEAPDHFILPGFIDAHVHVESSMLIPSEFARMAVVHGTVATVSDPHEIGNVMGVEGVEYMIENGKNTPFKFYFGAPSCVPATPFETAGALIGAEEIERLLSRSDIVYLAEMMNWPGVLSGEKDVYKKIAIAKAKNKVVDGHAPGLKGDQAKAYINAGISTDHECFTMEEALDKLKFGMKIIIREGSAARNFEALYPLLHGHADQIMFGSDDKHPDSLEEGHINMLVKRAIANGVDTFKVLRAACINPIIHYGLKVGRLRVGDNADFIVVDDLKEFRIRQTFIDGVLVAKDGQSYITRIQTEPINQFSVQYKSPESFAVKSMGKRIRVIEVIDNQIVTNQSVQEARIEKGFAISDTERDILKLTLVNRYHDSSPAIAFVKNFNLKSGAIASSVAHDSHNIIAVGVDDVSISRAVNLVISGKGGISAVFGNQEHLLPLPVAGIMSDADGYEVAKSYKEIDAMARRMGSTLQAPFMTLSFMALLVIPSLKLSDKGLFDGNEFKFVDLFFD